MKSILLSAFLLIAILLSVATGALPADLGTAANFAVLAGTTVTSTGTVGTVINGNIGVFPGSATTGFPPAVCNGAIVAHGVAGTAQNDLTTAYNELAGRPFNTTLSNQDLGGMTLQPRVYKFNAGANMNGILTLDARGDPAAIWVFQIGSFLNIAEGSSILFKDSIGNPDYVYWQVGETATIAKGVPMIGNILALAAIILNDGVTVLGRCLARNAAVNLDRTVVTITYAPSAAPTITPSANPSASPSVNPSAAPSVNPSLAPSAIPTINPSAAPSITPTKVPSAIPTINPSVSPSAVPTLNPSASPSATPSASPSVAPSVNPSASPSMMPSVAPSAAPSVNPTKTLSTMPSTAPSAAPSVNPSASPSVVPSAAPSATPSINPTVSPSTVPSFAPSAAPSVNPTASPSTMPSVAPSAAPSVTPSLMPSVAPSVTATSGPTFLNQPTAPPSIAPSASPSNAPTLNPSAAPSITPSLAPSAAPSMNPSLAPSSAPTLTPSSVPTVNPSAAPSATPSLAPSAAPSKNPSLAPSSAPTVTPSASPSTSPSAAPSAVPSTGPSATPTQDPSTVPSEQPSFAPSVSPTVTPSLMPSVTPTVTETSGPTFVDQPTAPPSAAPSVSPSNVPTLSPSASPSVTPSANPSVDPSMTPSVGPSEVPSVSPSAAPSMSPSVHPSAEPSMVPSAAPSVVPSVNPSAAPSVDPSMNPSATPSNEPSMMPSTTPTVVPSVAPSVETTVSPSFVNLPSAPPSTAPSAAPSMPTVVPSAQPTKQPFDGLPIDLGLAEPYAILAGTTVTSTGVVGTVVTGNIGIFPGSAITGFPPAVLNGAVDAANGASGNAQGSLTTAYNQLAGMAFNTTLSNQDLGGMTLPPGVYKFDAMANMNGILTLDARGDPAAVWVFQIGSSLLVAQGSSILFKDSIGNPDYVYWQVGSSATISIGVPMVGNILALTAITVNNGATVQGRCLARNAAVTLDKSVITKPSVVAFAATQTVSGISLEDFNANITMNTAVMKSAICETMPGVLPANIQNFAVTAGPTTSSAAVFLRRTVARALAGSSIILNYDVVVSSTQTAEQLQTQLRNAVNDGSFNTFLQNAATEQGATALTTATSDTIETETIDLAPAEPDSDNDGLTETEKMGISIAVVVGVAAIAFLLWWWFGGCAATSTPAPAPTGDALSAGEASSKIEF